MGNWKAFRTTSGALTDLKVTAQKKFLTLSYISCFRHDSAVTVTEQITDSKSQKKKLFKDKPL